MAKAPTKPLEQENRGKYLRTQEHRDKQSSLFKTGVLIPCGFCKVCTYVRPCELKASKKNNFYCSKNCFYSDLRRKNLHKVRTRDTLLQRREKQLLIKQIEGQIKVNGKWKKPCITCKNFIKLCSVYCQKCRMKNRTKEQKQQMSEAISNKLTGKMPKNMMDNGTFGNIKRGWYNINGKEKFFRSKWEANYALYLDLLVKLGHIKSWEFENKVFMFEKIKLGTRSYRPDFEVVNNDDSITYHEVKGYMDAKSKTKLKRMRIYHPNVNLILIQQKEYKELLKTYSEEVAFFQ